MPTGARFGGHRARPTLTGTSTLDSLAARNPLIPCLRGLGRPLLPTDRSSLFLPFPPPHPDSPENEEQEC